jgi:hypothetical protein
MTPSRKRLDLTEETCSHLKNLCLDTEQGQLDCLSVIDGLGDYKEVRRESEFVEVEGAKIRVLNLDALIRAKKAMNRPQDREAVAQLEAIKELRNRGSSCLED